MKLTRYHYRNLFRMLGIVGILFFIALHQSWAYIQVVASTQDLASIAQDIGGEHVKVEYLCRGNANPHSVEVLPSFMVKVSRAQLYLKLGVGLDFWADPIIEGSRNAKLKIVNCSKGVPIVEVPTGKVDASMGDVHPEGNPHYWLDPRNGLIIAQNIREALIELDPANATQYKQFYIRFETQLNQKLQEWTEKARPLAGMPIVTYHSSWSYFAQAFGIQVVGFIEPKPGIEPTPSHTANIIQLVKSKGVKVIVREPYFSGKTPNSIAIQTGAKVLVLPPSVGGVAEVNHYFELFDYLIHNLLIAQS